MTSYSTISPSALQCSGIFVYNNALSSVTSQIIVCSAVCWMFVKSQPNLPIVLEDDDDDPPLLSDVSATKDDAMITTRVEVRCFGLPVIL